MSYRDHNYRDFTYDARDEARYGYDYMNQYWYEGMSYEYPSYDHHAYFPVHHRPVKKLVKNSHLFKTELCSQWLAKGKCPYNHRCRFAHGPRELRPITRDANYRSKPCRKFKAQGWCPYGARCTFIHDPRDVNPPVMEEPEKTEEKPAEVDNQSPEEVIDDDVKKENSTPKVKLEMTRKLREKDNKSDVDMLTRTFADLGTSFGNISTN